MMWRWTMMAVLVAGAFMAQAAAVFRATASSSEVQVGEVFEISYTIENGTAGRLVPPDFAPFEVAYGPSRMQNYQFINGKVSRSISYTFGLRPTRTGKFNIPGATAEVDGKTERSNPLQVIVRQGGNGSSTSPSAGQEPVVPGKNKAWNKQLFVRVSADKQSLWEGEQVILTYKFYYRVGFENVQILKTPSYDGFLLHDFKVGQPEEQIETYDGIRYYTQVFKKIALFPNKPGKHTIPAIELECTVQEQGRDPFFDDPFFNRTKERRLVLRSNIVDLDVKPLPLTGRPADFTGAVGQFSLQAGIDKKQVATGDGATIKAVLRGQGNLKLAQLDTPRTIPGIDIYDPTVTEDLSAGSSALQGKKTFEYIVVPSAAGKYTIPPFSFSYFDPQTATYSTITSQPVELEVVPGELPTEEEGKKDTPGQWKGILAVALKVAGYGLALALGILLVAGIFFLAWWYRNSRNRKKRGRSGKTTADNVEEIKKKPSGVTTAQENQFQHEWVLLEQAFATKNSAAFYKRLPWVLWEAARRSGLDVTTPYERGALLTYLRQKDAGLSREVEQLLQSAEWQLYGGVSVSDLEKDRETLANIIDRI